MTLEHIIDPTAPTCERCGAVVHDPCATDEKKKFCQLPDFCFPISKPEHERIWKLLSNAGRC